MATKEAKEAVRCTRIIQINIERSLTAMSKLREYYTKRKVEVTYIQERTIRLLKNWRTDKLVNMSAASTSIFHNKDSVAAIIILHNIA